jgi:geranylgeranyl pyrophosphate synthase
MKCKINFDEINKRYNLDREINKIFKKIKNYSKEIKDLPNILDYLNYFLKIPSRRKRLIKLLATTKICGKMDKNAQKVINALELVNSAIFLHDDIIDHDLSRKGRPTLNKLIGYEKTILVGNMLFSLAMKEISEIKCKEKLKKEILSDFTYSLFIENVGQYSDVYFRNNFDKKNFKDWEKMVLRHSGFYVISALKAITKLNGKEDIAIALEEYEKNCTLAGAAEDALIGFIGNRKPRGDLKNHGFTILVYYALENNTKPIKNCSQKILEKMIKSSGAIQKTKEYIKKRVESSLEALKKIPESYEKKVLSYLVTQIKDEIKNA